MKRFLVFACQAYYPQGGWFDFQDSFDNLEDAHSYLNEIVNNGFDYGQIVDLETGKEVEE